MSFVGEIDVGPEYVYRLFFISFCVFHSFSTIFGADLLDFSSLIELGLPSTYIEVSEESTRYDREIMLIDLAFVMLIPYEIAWREYSIYRRA